MIINLNAVVHNAVVPFISIYNFYICINFNINKGGNSHERVREGKKIYSVEIIESCLIYEIRGKRKDIKGLLKDSKKNSVVL